MANTKKADKAKAAPHKTTEKGDTPISEDTRKTFEPESASEPHPEPAPATTEQDGPESLQDSATTTEHPRSTGKVEDIEGGFMGNYSNGDYSGGSTKQK